MYIPRQILGSLKQALRQFPAVLITGPRQSGKTTFLQHEFGKQFKYVSFDDPFNRDFVITDPKGFLAKEGNQPLILDEIQYVPQLLSYIKIRIDQARNKTGRWLLTGSQQFSLMKNVSESLAGRIALFELLPFSCSELPDDIALEDIVWNGCYPEPSLYPEKRNFWVNAYIQTYIERDIRMLQNVQDLRTFETFLALCASRHGQVFNQSGLARECGMSVPTIKSWGNLLQASYVVYFLSPYFKNYGKRLIKSPKLYFIDPALVCAFTRQPNGEAALASVMGGVLFEGLIVSEAIKIFSMMGKKPDLFYWRSHDGLEVDLIVQIHGKFYPIEIKLTTTPTPRHLESLNKFKSLAGADAGDTGVLVCRVDSRTSLPNNNLALPWREFSKWLQERLLSS